MPTEQGLEHLKFTVGHLRAHTDVAERIVMLLESYMIFIGTISPQFQDTTTYKYVTAPWIETLKLFLQYSDTTITTPFVQCPAILREHDQPIMQIALAQQLPNKNIISINSCRLWLQIATISEMTNIDGNILLSTAANGDQNELGHPTLWQTSLSLLHWPIKQRPGPSAWKCWKRFIKNINKAATLHLGKPLGP
jgi:hypothetical protein